MLTSVIPLLWSKLSLLYPISTCPKFSLLTVLANKFSWLFDLDDWYFNTKVSWSPGESAVVLHIFPSVSYFAHFETSICWAVSVLYSTVYPSCAFMELLVSASSPTSGYISISSNSKLNSSREISVLLSPCLPPKNDSTSVISTVPLSELESFFPSGLKLILYLINPWPAASADFWIGSVSVSGTSPFTFNVAIVEVSLFFETLLTRFPSASRLDAILATGTAV